MVAPTGSGKTLAAFLWALDRLAALPGDLQVDADAKKSGGEGEERRVGPGESGRPRGVRVLYISPLKALGVDVERNLRAPLAGLKEASLALGRPAPQISVGVRSGDTTAAERRRILAHPPDVLITTPESLYLLLTSKGAEILKSVDTVIVDEVHALAGNKRGAHLALSLERLDDLLDAPAQRIGLSATVEPAEEVARFLAGSRQANIVRPASGKTFDVVVEVPVEDMTDPPVVEREMVNANSTTEHRIGSMWPSIEASLYERVLASRSTIVFTNSRRLAERLTARLNQIHAEAHQETGEDGEATHLQDLARAHHGSMSKEHRRQVEEALKAGELRCVVATASLELGIDMGDVDLVVQIDPAPSVSSALQRMGRSGHQVGGRSAAVFYPTHRSKLLETAVLAERMKAGQIEKIGVLSNPLDVLAQQTVAAAVAGDLDVEGWYQTVRRSAPFRGLPRSAFLAVLDLVSGKYPSTEFSALRARVDWDRHTNTLRARPGAQRLAVTNGGTIPDRGMYRVVAGGDEGASAVRVGELDEEMVYETRVGEVFSLGTTPWRVRRITRDTVEVEPAFGVVAKTPFWRGDSPSRTYELGRALGDMAASLEGASLEDAQARLSGAGLDDNAVSNALAYLHEQAEHAGAVPTSDRLLVEKTRDDVGDWQYILESPYGSAVHAPWALAINARLRDLGVAEGKATPSNDGVIVRLPDVDAAPAWEGAGARTTLRAEDIFIFDPAEIGEIVRLEVENSAVFAARFREAASRALILGSSTPGQRSPLWQQRLRAASLLEVASKYSDFPIILEALREVLQDVYDVDALTLLMSQLQARRLSMVEVETQTPSPYARSLLFGYVGEFMYAGDTPAGERRIAALSVDPEVLRELLGEVALKDLLEPQAIEDVTAELQRTKDGWRVRGVPGLVDLLRSLGPLTESEMLERFVGDRGDLSRALAEMAGAHRAVAVRMGGHEHWAAVEDAAVLESIGVVLPAGVPAAFLKPAEDGLEQLLARHLSTNGPVTEEELSERFALSTPSLRTVLGTLESRGFAVVGQFLPEEVLAERGSGSGPQWVARSVLDRLRSRSLAVLRAGVEPASQAAYAQFLQEWQACGQMRRGIEGTAETLTQLAGVPLPASAWETLIIPQRVRDFQTRQLDQLVSGGEFRWIGGGAIGGRDGWVYFEPVGEPTSPPEDTDRELDELEEGIVRVLRERGALFASALSEGLAALGLHPGGAELAEAVWALVWDGIVTSDAVEALRARVAGRRSAQKTAPRRPRGRSVTRRRLAAGLPAAAAGSGFGPELTGRWSLVRESRHAGGQVKDAEITLRSVQMLERYGVVARGAVLVENFPGGFAQAYRLYADFEASGVCRRGYFVSGLGGAQFAAPGAVDELRRVEDRSRQEAGVLQAVTLASTDPANPYGAAIPWPKVEGTAQPKRSAGSIVCILGGKLAFYLERGGRTALSFLESEGHREDREVQEAVAQSLVDTIGRGDLATFTLENLNGTPISTTTWADPLLAAGFSAVPRGLTLRRKIR